MTEVVKGVHWSGLYGGPAVLTENRLVLVDTGVKGEVDKLLDFLAKVPVKPSDLTTIVITHTHPDHVGGLATIKTQSPAKVASHRIEAEFISQKTRYTGPPGPRAHDHPGTPVDVKLEDGQTIDGLRVIFAPGHTKGSIALLDGEKGLLIAGDTMRTEAGLAPMDDVYNVDPKQHRASIKKIAGFDFENLVCGHGPPVVGGAGKRVKALAATL